jgi:hypothetical protein
MANYMQHAAGKLIDLVTPEARRRKSGLSKPQAQTSITYDYISSDSSDSFVLGRAGLGKLGSTALLGTSTVEVTGVLNVEIMMRASEWKMLLGHSVALLLLKQVCDMAVPLNMNFRMYFSGLPEERTFVVRFIERARKTDRKQVLLGVTSALGTS